MNKWLRLPLALIKALMPSSTSKKTSDPRSYMHGIGSAKAANGDDLVFFSSSGIPPLGAKKNNKWSHDIYLCKLSANDKMLSPPIAFIQKPGAQEPVSVAQTANGHIMLTFEDSWNSLPERMSQRYGVYDMDLQPIAPYPQDIEKGGHSGHVAAVGNSFVVFYSCGWIRGGGVKNLGTGNGVYASIHDNTGRLMHKVEVATNSREWWPMVAGSPDRALLLWQKFVPESGNADLIIAVLDPQNAQITSLQTLRTAIECYAYNVAYVPTVERFLIIGTSAGKRGFAYLIDNNGNIVTGPVNIPATVREAGIAINGNMAYIPSADNRLIHLALTGASIAITATQPSSLNWSPVGSVGLVKNASEICWLSLTKNGLKEINFNLPEATVC